MHKVSGNKDKNNESAADETHEIFRDNNIMGRKMRRGQGCSQRPGQQMEIHRDEQTAKKNTPGIISRKKHKSDDAGDPEQDPVCSGDKYQYSLLNFHLGNVRLSLKISVPFL